MKSGGKLRGWLYEHRTSTRLTFVLRLVATAVSSLMAFIWTPLLLVPMGDKLYGLFMSFQVIPRLGGLGDLGISGAVAVRAGQMIGRNDYDRLKPFLASARALFLIVAPALGLIFFVLSPWLPGWLHFESVPGAGSLTLLFQTGAVLLCLMVGGGYVYSVNAAYNNILWPILPSLLVSQLAILGHWLLARAGSPLWAQNLPYVLSTAINLVAVWWMLRAAHPWLAQLRPIKVDWSLWRELISTSGWVYLYTLGSLIFSMTDRLLINAGIGSAAVPGYLFNYKPCELALQVVAAACFASQAKINHWIANPAEESQQRVRRELQRLCMFQSFIGTASALGYLALNNLFIGYWVGDSYHGPSPLQWAFALTLVITAGGDAGIQAAGLCGPKGLRTAGLAIGATGLLNLVLSFIAMRAKSLVGIAFATVIAQTVLSLFLSWHTCRHLKVSFFRWSLKSWWLPVATVILAAALQGGIGSNTWTQAGILAAIFLALAVVCGWMSGINREFLRTEINILRSYLPR